MARLILLRHGQSIWNQRNLFTGWVDIGLSQKGVEECLQAGRMISSWNVDVIYTSALVRAQNSALIAMSCHSTQKTPYIVNLERDVEKEAWYENIGGSKALIPIHSAWELNERMYGDLQGKNKQQMIEEHGAEQVQLWRRSYKAKPPGGESLADTISRTIPFFKEKIKPHLDRGEDVFIAAHGNSLRAIVMYVEQIEQEDIMGLEIATGEIRSYNYQGEAFTRS